jgi:precorrin-3B C17-methyltransferase
VTVALALCATAGRRGRVPNDFGASFFSTADIADAVAAELEAMPESGGMVLVVGTGAGKAGLLTGEAVAAIGTADTVLGYRTYIEQLRPLFPDKEYVASAMGKELERCREALAMAAQGRIVAMVSSGDPGVYGMAGPMLELADGVPVYIIPGVTSAQTAASLLGAPLMNDYVTISLSDLLTPRDEVLRRARAAAASGLVVCIYNPTSKKRQPLFEEVCGIMLEYRPAATPVGWVRDAGGAEEEWRIIRLDELIDQENDMRTILIVGNGDTRVINNRMVTRRGYRGDD